MNYSNHLVWFPYHQYCIKDLDLKVFLVGDCFQADPDGINDANQKNVY